MLDVSEARGRILEKISIVGVEKVSILSSLGRVLALDIVSDINLPPFRNSAVDGYAVCYEDTRGASVKTPIKLKITGVIAAGAVFEHLVKNGEAVKIMTGAPMPNGATAVVMVEDTKSDNSVGLLEKNNEVIICKEVTQEENIRQIGEDVCKGEIVISKGKRIRPQEIAMLASLGYYMVSIYKRPKVAILSTGDELVEISEAIITPGKIRNSNSYSIAALVAQYGGEPVQLGIAKDSWEDTEEKIKSGLKDCDVFITSAGVSVGEYDLVKDVFKSIGVELSFWQVAMQPGRPVVFGVWNNKLIFGLPGNPVSSMIAFEEFVRPAILAASGDSFVEFLEVWAIAHETIKKKHGRTHFMRGVCWKENGSFYVKLTGSQGSGIQKSMVAANCIVIVPKDISEIKKGETVTIQLLNHFPLPLPYNFNTFLSKGF